MRITLGEFNEFQKSLTNDWYFLDDGLDDDFWEGKFDPTEVVDIKQGDVTIAWQGKDPAPRKEYLDFLTEFKKWKGGIDFEIISVKVPKDKKEIFMKFIKENGIT